MDNSNQNPKQALVDKLKDSKNILVTVSANPNVDQLAACLGLTIWLNKIDKHATAVFSGEVPSTLEFLQPAETLEKNTDSLRDFIISLDKSKADKLRYKVEDSVVKVFVTPYRTSLTADDLEFSQGDFNIDMIIALGVHKQDELDDAITSHGRILHDATVATVTIGEQGSELGSIGWHDGQASSLCELVVDLANTVDQKQIDSQIATALLTGVVAETDRFSNNKTTPQTMSISAQLMSAGANQQLVATKLSEPVVVPEPIEETPETPDPEADTQAQPPENKDGLLSIERNESDETPEPEQPQQSDEPEQPEGPTVENVEQTVTDEPDLPQLAHFTSQEPQFSGTLTANAKPEDESAEQTSDPFSQPDNQDQPLLDHDEPDALQPAPPDWMPPQPWMNPEAPDEQNPVDEEPVIEPDFTSLPSVPEDEPAPEPQGEEDQSQETSDLDAARDEVQRAMEAARDEPQEPIEALNALPIDLNESTDELETVIEVIPDEPVLPPKSSTEFNPAAFNVMNDPEINRRQYTPAEPLSADPNQPVDPELVGPVEQPYTMPLPSPLMPPPANPTPPTSVEFDPMAPPPVPPPMLFGQPK